MGEPADDGLDDREAGRQDERDSQGATRRRRRAVRVPVVLYATQLAS